MTDMRKETWQNVTRGTAAVLKLDSRGNEFGYVIPSGAKVTLSPEERRINQDRAASKAQDLFSNGTLEPHGSWASKLLDADEDLADEYKDIAENPNFISESEIKELFKLRIDAFRRRLADIENRTVVDRILSMAHDLDAKASQIKAIEDRVEEFRPENLVEVETTGGPAAARPATP